MPSEVFFASLKHEMCLMIEWLMVKSTLLQPVD